MNDGVGALAVFVVRSATRVPCLALLPPFRFQDTALMLMVMCVVTDMLHGTRTFFVQAIRRHNSSSPLQRQKQHEESDQEISHGADCRGQQTCRHLADARATGRNGKTWDGRHNWSLVMKRLTPRRPILCPATAASLSVAEIQLVHLRPLLGRYVRQFLEHLLARFTRAGIA